jgi:integrase
MPTIFPFVRKSTKKGNDFVSVRFRVMLGRSGDLYYVSNILVNCEHWDTKRHCLKSKAFISPTEHIRIEKAVIERKMQVTTAFENLIRNGIEPTSKALTEEMCFLLNPNMQKNPNEKSFFEYFDDYCSQNKVSENRQKMYAVMRRTLLRFENYKKYSDKNFELNIHKFSPDTAMELQQFMENEYNIAVEYPCLYQGERKVNRRSGNTISNRVTIIIGFFNWCVKPKKIITCSPYDDIEYPKEVYGTPYYLTIDERNQLYKYDFSKRPELEKQRDIFVFHCFVGCRVGDLLRMKKSNIINGAIEYIAGKTKDGNPKTLRVPLNNTGLEILEKYKDLDGDRLFPFISEQKYNKDIKKVFEIAGINRMVTILDPITRRDVQKPIYEVASSHLARRTLYANVYKKFKDPALAGSLTGHAPNSRAALRYRDIDDEIKLELVRSLE